MKAPNIERMRIAACLAVLGISLGVTRAGSLFTNPVIVITPRAIDFGEVPRKEWVTNTFVVENWGGGKLVGKATVPRPFKILSGASYKLGSADVQIVTIAYSPSEAGVDTNVVKFTGGTGILAPVTGKLGVSPPGKEK